MSSIVRFLTAILIGLAGQSAYAATVGPDGPGTIVVQNEEMALQGIFCEKHGTDAGDRAAAFLTEVLGAGGLTRCRGGGEPVGGLSGAYCNHNGSDLGALLISEGLCVRCPARDPDERYVEAQAAAPIWQGSIPNECADQ